MKDILGFEGKYAVTEEGQVYSYRMKRFVKPWKDGSGHYQVGLGRKIKRKVHRLVAEAFIPNPEGHPLVLHGSSGKEDNSVGNLRWGTSSDNLRDANTFGERPAIFVRGVCHGNSKLSEEDVKQIYHLSHNSKLTQKQIGDKFGITYAQVSQIKLKRQWGHVTDLLD